MKKTLLLILVLSTYIGQALAQYPQGYKLFYPFSQNCNDTSGHGFHGTGHNTTFVTDRFNKPNRAIYFNGTNAWVQSTYMPQSLTGFTICAWIKTASNNTGTPTTRQIFGFRGTGTMNQKGLEFEYYENTGAYTWGLGGNDLWTARSLVYTNNNQWMHVACVWTGTSGTSIDTTQFRFYINGVLQNTTANYYNPFSVPATSAPLSMVEAMRLGTVGMSSWFVGAMDDVIIYEKVLTPQQIDSVRNAAPLDVAEMNEQLSGYAVYPNPATDHLSLSYNGTNAEAIEVKLLTNTGQCVRSIGKQTISAGSPYRMDISGLPAGLYFVQMVNAGGSRQIIPLTKN